MPTIPLHPNITELRGRTFGRLTVREYAGSHNRHAYWLADCECGTIGHQVRGKNLVAGQTISCGCLRADPAIRAAAWSNVPKSKRIAHAKRAALGRKRNKPKTQKERGAGVAPREGARRRKTGLG